MWVWRQEKKTIVQRLPPLLPFSRKPPILQLSHSKLVPIPCTRERSINTRLGKFWVEKSNREVMELAATETCTCKTRNGYANTNEEKHHFSPSANRLCAVRARCGVYEDFSCWVETRWSETTMKHVSWGVWNEGYHAPFAKWLTEIF